MPLQSNNRSSEPSRWSKERSSQQLELEEDATHGLPKVGCCNRCLEWAIKMLHFIDISLGVALLIYGSLLYTQEFPEQQQHQERAMAAIAFCWIFGSFHLVSSMIGILSFASIGRGCTKSCNCCCCSCCTAQFGLTISAYAGPYFTISYFTMLIALLVDTSGFLQYIDDHKEVMYLGPDVAERCKNLMPLFYTILAVLGLLESSRFCVLIMLIKFQRQHDEADALIPGSIYNDTNDGGRPAPTAVDHSLTEALLGDNDHEAETTEAGDGGAVGKETAEKPNWWEN